MKLALPTLTPTAPDPNYLKRLEYEAKAGLNTSTKDVKRFRRELEGMAGLPIRVRYAVSGIGAAGVLRSAYNPGTAREQHVIELGQMPPWQAVHAEAHELMHLELQVLAEIDDVLELPRPQVQAVLDRCGRIEHGGDYFRAKDEMATVCACLVDIPQDMIVEARLLRRFPSLAAAQKHWALTHEAERARTVLTAHDPAERALPVARQAYTALSGAAAIAWDDLLKDSTCADFYRAYPEWSLSEQIFAAYQRHVNAFKPGMETALVKEVAKIVDFDGALKWKGVSTWLPERTYKAPSIE